MTAFEDLKSQWDDQPEITTPNKGSEQIIKKITFIKNGQRITDIVLVITVIVLIGFFFYISAYRNTLVAKALLLMIGSLLVRIIIEFFSIKSFKKINITINTTVFKQKMMSYYKKRIKIHYIMTPIIVGLYIIGFVVLLSFFKVELSYGFYIYIKVSAIIILIILGFFIRKQIIKELTILKELYN